MPLAPGEPQLGVELGGLALLLVGLLGDQLAVALAAAQIGPQPLVTQPLRAALARAIGRRDVDGEPPRRRDLHQPHQPPQARVRRRAATDASPPPARRSACVSQSRADPQLGARADRLATARGGARAPRRRRSCRAPAAARRSASGVGRAAGAARCARARRARRRRRARTTSQPAPASSPATMSAEAQRVGGRALVRATLERAHPRPPRAPKRARVHDVAGGRHAAATVEAQPRRRARRARCAAPSARARSRAARIAPAAARSPRRAAARRGRVDLVPVARERARRRRAARPRRATWMRWPGREAARPARRAARGSPRDAHARRATAAAPARTRAAARRRRRW